jgi:hypothetical protein
VTIMNTVLLGGIHARRLQDGISGNREEDLYEALPTYLGLAGNFGPPSIARIIAEPSGFL